METAWISSEDFLDASLSVYVAWIERVCMVVGAGGGTG